MSSALENFENSRFFWVFFVVAFPVLFLAIWSFVLWITSNMSGWRRLARLYPYRKEHVSEWKKRGGGGVYSHKLPFAGMRGRLAVGASKEGYVIKPPFIIRPFHPSLYLPFEKVQNEEDRKFLTLDWVIITMRDMPDVQIVILKSARDMVRQ